MSLRLTTFKTNNPHILRIAFDNLEQVKILLIPVNLL